MSLDGRPEGAFGTDPSIEKMPAGKSELPAETETEAGEIIKKMRSGEIADPTVETEQSAAPARRRGWLRNLFDKKAA